MVPWNLPGKLSWISHWGIRIRELGDTGWSCGFQLLLRSQNSLLSKVCHPNFCSKFYPPMKRSHIPPWREKGKSSTQKCRLGGVIAVSSQEGKIHPNRFFTIVDSGGFIVVVYKEVAVSYRNTGPKTTSIKNTSKNTYDTDTMYT